MGALIAPLKDIARDTEISRLWNDPGAVRYLMLLE